MYKVTKYKDLTARNPEKGPVKELTYLQGGLSEWSKP